MSITTSANIFVFFVAIVILFQLALAAGMPWGRLSNGGKFPGRLPKGMRFASVFQAGILAVFGVIVLTKSGSIYPQWVVASKTAIWVVVAFSALATIMNLITPSKWERIIWAPVSIIMLITVILVAKG